ncbi:MAG: glycosyltransferase family 4 protein [Bacteriovoracaceae bacterium]|nr:glycosyltransferase family 4 protein [Bacteriovoracaceae bacterium]
MLRNSGKPIILTFVGNYLPGYKSGGILRTISNTVDYLCDDFEFWIVTRDRDLGEEDPYHGVRLDQWQQVGNAMVYYLRPQSSGIKDMLNLIVSTPHNVLYLNSFFDSFTVKVLLIRRLGWANFKQVIVAPRGEFAWGSLGLKYPKKLVYILLSRLLGLYEKVVWQASSEFEAQNIIKVMKISPDAVHIALDLPNKINPDETPDTSSPLTSGSEGLRLIFLSRIAREKNLDYALRVLSKVDIKVVLDIYGPAVDAAYWNECCALIRQLPDNVTVNYLDGVNPADVVPVFSRYDLFLFPTAGENYGHVIAESLAAGTPVLISTETPWRNLQAEGLGWDIDLFKIDSFVKVIRGFALLSNNERLKKRAIIKSKIMERLLDPSVIEANRQLFKRQLLSRERS